MCPALGLVQFNFADLCGYFALFAVSYLFYRKGREERAKKRKGIPAQSCKPNQYVGSSSVINFLALL
jgi:hypothetical protein